MSVKDRALQSNEYLRAKRNVAFKAFDIYKENVNYGLVSETQEEHTAIVEWYNKCLELDAEAINNVPPQIERFKSGVKGVL